MEKVKLSNLIKFEEVLLRIKRRHDDNSFKLPFNLLVKLESELDGLSKITNLYFSEINKITDASEKEMDEINTNFLESEVDYDLDNYKLILTSEVVSNFYKKR